MVVSASAAMPACWMKGATEEWVTSTISAMASRVFSGSTIQPRRQPVMIQVLLKLLQTMVRSSGVAISRSEGAAWLPS